MLSTYTPLDRCIGKEVTVRTNGDEYVGMLAGIYQLNGVSILVLVPMNGSQEHHIPLIGAVVTLRQSAWVWASQWPGDGLRGRVRR